MNLTKTNFNSSCTCLSKCDSAVKIVDYDTHWFIHRMYFFDKI